MKSNVTFRLERMGVNNLLFTMVGFPNVPAVQFTNLSALQNKGVRKLLPRVPEVGDIIEVTHLVRDELVAEAKSI